MFQSNKILTEKEAAADAFKSARERKKIKIADAGHRLNINQKYLSAIESGNWDLLPPGVYSRNFIKEYSGFLGLKSADFLEIFDRELNRREKSKTKVPDIFTNQIVKKKDLLILPRLARNVLVGVIGLACIFYLGFLLNQTFRAPNLRVDSPVDNWVATENAVEIKGVSESEAIISVNGQPIPADQSGSFSVGIGLKPGVNTITVTAQKKYSRPSVVIRKVLVK